MFEKLTLFSIDRPKTVIALMTLITILFGLQFPNVVYKVSDAFSATLGISLFGGKNRTTFLGQFDRNDNLFLNLRYDF